MQCRRWRFRPSRPGQVPLAVLAAMLLLVACDANATAPASPTAVVSPDAGATVFAPPPPTQPPVTATPSLLRLAAEPAFSMGSAGPLDDLSADGFSWSQSGIPYVDRHGKILTLAQQSTAGKDLNLVYSNDAGRTWASTDLHYVALERGMFAVDEAHDILHLLVKSQSLRDGMIYRRLTITRDRSQNITAITADADINLILDQQAMSYSHPSILYLDDPVFGRYGAVLCLWSMTTATGAEIRATMRVLSNTAADNLAANWIAPVTPETSTLGQSPTVAYSQVAPTISGSDPSILRLAAGDVIVFYWDGSQLFSRRMRWNAAGNFSTGLTEPVSVLGNISRSGTNTGYRLKSQCLSRPVEDRAGTVWIGIPNWKSDADGDSWSIRSISSQDTLGPVIDVYSAGGPHSYAPTGDLGYDHQTNTLLVAYLTSGATQNDNRIEVATYVDGVEQQRVTVASPENADIPYLSNRRIDGDTAYLLMFRDAIDSPAVPYQGYVALLTIQ